MRMAIKVCIFLHHSSLYLNIITKHLAAQKFAKLHNPLPLCKVLNIDEIDGKVLDADPLLSHNLMIFNNERELRWVFFYSQSLAGRHRVSLCH